MGTYFFLGCVWHEVFIVRLVFRFLELLSSDVRYLFDVKQFFGVYLAYVEVYGGLWTL